MLILIRDGLYNITREGNDMVVMFGKRKSKSKFAVEVEVEPGMLWRGVKKRAWETFANKLFKKEKGWRSFAQVKEKYTVTRCKFPVATLLS